MSDPLLNELLALALSNPNIKSASLNARGEAPAAGETRMVRRQRLTRNAVGQMAKCASALPDQLMQLVQQHPEILTGLATGAVGGGLTAMSARKRGEGIGGKAMRVGLNALLAGGLGAGAHALGRYGMQNFGNALPASDVDPVSDTLQNSNAKYLAGGAAGGSAVGWGLKDFKAERAGNAAQNINNAIGSSNAVSHKGGAAQHIQGRLAGSSKSTPRAIYSGIFDPTQALTIKGENMAQKGYEMAGRGGMEKARVQELLRAMGVNYAPTTDVGKSKNLIQQILASLGRGKFRTAGRLGGRLYTASGAERGVLSLRNALNPITSIRGQGGIRPLARTLGKGGAAAAAGYYALPLIQEALAGATGTDA